MNKNHRIFLIRMVVVFSLLALGNLFFNILIDMYKIFGTPTWAGINSTKHGVDRHARIAKAYAVMQSSPEAAILGSSRAESALDPMHPLFSGQRTYNLAFPGAAVYEQFRYLQHAAHSGQLKKAMVALDFHQFLGNQQKLSSDFRENRLAVDAQGTFQSYPWLDAISLVASGSAFKESWWSLRHQRNQESIYRSDGYRNDSGDVPAMHGKKGGQKIEFLASERSYVRVYRSGASALTNYQLIKREPEKDVQDMLELGRQQNIEVVFVISPIHARHLALIKAMGLWERFENWKRQLALIVGEPTTNGQCAIRDFTTINEITSEAVQPEDSKIAMKWWRESSHASSAAGWKMLDVIQSGMSPIENYGDCLTPSGIDALLAREREALSKWENSNPADLAEIQNLAKNGL